MNVTPRAIPTLAFVLLATLVTACGVEAGGGNDAAVTASTVAVPTTDVDGPDTTTSEPESSTTTTEPDAPTTTKPSSPTTEPSTPSTIDPGIGDLPPEYQDQVLEGMIEAFVEGGLTQEQAECLADSYGRDILDGADIDLGDSAGMLQYFTDCGVDPTQL